MNMREWRELAAKVGRPAPNSCVNCKFELTCAYSSLATSGERDEFSFGPCILGEKSYGNGPFFEKRWRD
jgi:hypothetical protein